MSPFVVTKLLLACPHADELFSYDISVLETNKLLIYVDGGGVPFSLLEDLRRTPSTSALEAKDVGCLRSSGSSTNRYGSLGSGIQM